MTTSAEPYADLRSGLKHCRETLCQASWSASWEIAEPKILAARDELAAALAVLAVVHDGMPDDYDKALSHLTAFEALWAGCVEALQLVSRSIESAAQRLADGEQPTLASRRLISQAVRTLDTVLSSVAKS